MTVRATFRAIAIVATTLALAGCGGGGSGDGGGSATGGESAASLVPATARAFVAIDTDFDSDQVKTADNVLKKFPGRNRALAAIRKSIRQSGIDPEALQRSAGPELDVAFLGAGGDLAVGFTKPQDKAEFIRILESGNTPAKHIEKDGWIVFSDEQAALDAVQNADEKLADLQPYKDAIAELPEEALAKGYASRVGIRSLGAGGLGVGALGGAAPGALKGTKWASGAVLAHDDGVELQGFSATGAGGFAPYTATLTDDIPSGSVLALSFKNAGQAVDQLRSSSAGTFVVPTIEQALGVSLADLQTALTGEGVVYVRPGTPIPEVALITKPADEQQALAVVDRLVQHLAPSGAQATPTTVAGVPMKRLSLGVVGILYGVVDGKLVVTNSANAVQFVQDGGDSLKDDATFKETSNAVGLPDQTGGWLYLDFKDGVPLVEGLYELSGDQLPAEVTENLRPLRSAILYTSRDGEIQNVKAFVGTS
jgi:hypothetical protein